MAAAGTDEKVAELYAAAADAVQCSADRVRFVNECEGVLARLSRAVIHCKSKYPGQPEIFDGIPDKDALVHFTVDCVRNRFPLRNRVSELKQRLIDGNKEWKKAFDEHLKRCPTCRTVDLHVGGPKPEPPAKKQKLPIAFIVELLALLGLLLPLFALGQGCDCHLRFYLLVFGLLLILPWLVFEILWWRKRVWVIRKFLLAGKYAIDVPDVPAFGSKCLHRLWAPSSVLVRHPIEGPEGASRVCTAWGYWGRHVQMPAGATVETTPGSADGWSVVKLTCEARKWSAMQATLTAPDAIQGLPVAAKCTGDSIVFEPERAGGEPRVWIKLGCWRLDSIRKTLIALAASGFLIAVVAAIFHPGLTWKCDPEENTETRLVRTPLRAVFLLDASSSVSDPSFVQEKQATWAIVDAFVEVYQPDVDRVHVGAVQFASDSSLELPLTNNLTLAANTVRAIPRLRGGTVFEGALEECQRQLDIYTGAGSDTFDLCVLLTDGETGEDVDTLKAILTSSTNLMGIAVGDQAGRDKLFELTSCAAGDADCPFFVSATDFEELKQNARELAQGVTAGLEETVEETTYEYVCDPPYATIAGLLLIIPFLIWWLWLHCAGRKKPPAEEVHIVKDPDRLKTVGANQGHVAVGKGRV